MSTISFGPKTQVSSSAHGDAAADKNNAELHGERARAFARVASEDSVASIFTEAWASAAAWTQPGTPGTQISAGKVFSTGIGGGASGMNHSNAIGTGNLRATMLVTMPAAFGGSGGVIVGVSKDAAGAIPAAGAANAFGLYFHSAIGVPDSMDTGVATALTTGPQLVVGVTYLVTITVDAVYISVTATSLANGDVIRTRRLRAGFAVNNLFAFNSDNRALTGIAIGAVSARNGLASIPSNETAAQRVIYSGDGAGSDWMLYLPTTFDSRVPIPLVIGFHGNGSDEFHWSTNSNGRAAKDALVAAGYAFLGAAGPNKSSWGAQNSLDAYVAAYNWARTFLPIDSVVFYANSMGGIESLLVLASRKIPGVLGWVGTSPTANLADNYTGGGGQFTTLINTAYGMADATAYAASTLGHDPILLAPQSFRLPMLFLAATDDVAVSKVANADAFAAKVTGYASVTLQAGITGGHSFSFTPYTAQIVSFLDTARAK